MKKFAWVAAFVIAVAVVGCAQKSESEKLADQMKRTASQMEKDANKAAKDLEASFK